MSYSNNSNIPIELIPNIGWRTAKILRQMEITTIGQFKQLPEKILVELFGPSILKIYWQITNTTRHQIKPYVMRPRKNWLEKIKIASSFLSFL